jgi:hypothetical protein
MFLNNLLRISLIAVRLRCRVAMSLQRAAPGRGVEEMVGNRGVWYEHRMSGGVFLVRRRHIDHGVVWTCACPCSR